MKISQIPDFGVVKLAMVITKVPRIAQSRYSDLRILWVPQNQKIAHPFREKGWISL